MADIRTLVVLGSSATGLAVARSAHRSGLKVIVVDSRRGPAAYSRRVHFQLIADETAASILAAVQSDCLPGPIGFIADSDRYLSVLAREWSEFSARGTILHASSKTLQTCLDKTLFHQWCVREGIQTPQVYPICPDTPTRSLKLPVVLRPRRTCHDRSRDVPKAVEVRDWAELGDALKVFAAARETPVATSSLLSQKIRCFSVGIARRGDGKTRSLVAERVRPVPGRCLAGTFVKLRPQREVQEFAELVTRRLDLFGIAEVEIIQNVDSKELHVIEVNPRPWLQFALSDCSGHNLLEFLMDRPSSGPWRPRTTGLSWIDLRADLFYAFSRRSGAIMRREFGLWEYLKTLLGRHEHPTFSWSDPRPFLLSWLGKVC